MMWDTPPPPPPPNPTTKQQTPNFSFSAYLLYVVQTHLLLEGPAVAASPIMHCTLLLLFIPLIFFFLLNYLIPEKHQRQNENIKQR